MKKDLPENNVEDIAVAVVLESESPGNKSWRVYLLNLKTSSIATVLVSSKGYGIKNGENVKTSILRHSIGTVESRTYAAIEAIDDQVLGLTNEYWVSYYINGVIYDKKFIFLPESITDGNLIHVPLVDKPGVMIGAGSSEQ